MDENCTFAAVSLDTPESLNWTLCHELHDNIYTISTSPLKYFVIFKNNNNNEKSAKRRCKHCVPAVVMWSTKISPRGRPPSRGCGTAKIESSRDGHYLYPQTQFGEDRCTQFRVTVVTDPQSHKHTMPARCKKTGPITIHCTGKISTQCNNNTHLTAIFPG